LGLLRKQKKYGLVWEDKPEDVEERLREELPVLVEDISKAIISTEADAPNHILIEGDNLETLTALAYTHEGKIDVIYIDPPYNTGNNDFVYNDKFVDKEDSYRHSKWLSFMAKRLCIAKQLLSDKGVIFISIDDNEQAQLKLLCDEIFGENNFIASCVRKRRDSQANLSHNISPIHEYVFIFCKRYDDLLNKIPAIIDDKDYRNPDNDPRGPYKTMPCTNKGGAVYSVTTPTGRIITEEWRFKKETYDALLEDNRLVFPRGGEGKPRYKLFLRDKKNEGVLANTWLSEIASNQQGTIELKDIFDELPFNNPKPIGLLKFLLILGSQTNSTILDFFAGSGTTLHATMQLNAEDGGHRKCILVTNNENNICEEVTYERNKRVIKGYTTPKGEEVAGLAGNTLRYYRTSFVGRNRSIKNMRQLMNLSTDMLCIKEDLYMEQPKFGEQPTYKNVFRYFDNSKKRMMIIYREEAVQQLVELIQKTDYEGKMLVYVFSPSEDPWEGEFDEVQDRVQLCALPQAIYNAYRRILPKKKDEFIGADETKATGQTNATDGMLNFDNEEEQQ
jgi:adenine-specific DNA-methyltransferase